MRKELGIFILLALLCAVVAVINPRFLVASNLQNISRLIGMFGILSIGAGVVIITSGIDLSVGSIMALVGILLSIFLTEKKWPSGLAVLAVIAIAGGLGWIHGLFITRLKIQPFIVTLCGLLFYRGLARFIANDATQGYGGEGFMWLRNLASGQLFHIPTPFLFLILIGVLMWIVLQRSVYGRYLFAVGRNEDAARYSGIDTRKIVSSAYVLSGLLAGITGVLLAFYTNSISPSSHGNFYELYAIAAAVLGGCSLRGGEGSVIGIVIGTALLQVLQNLVNLLGIPSSLNFAVMGTVILIGVVADELVRRRAARKRVAQQ
ncbi:MAG TPA: ABC transporter permease [Terriglobales bacterium]|jgi:ribose transport system permease protein